jgi:hypothetical protein
MNKYLKTRNDWADEDTVEDVDWTAYGRAIKRVEWKQQVLIVKQLHRLLPTADRLHKFKQQSHDRCKLCNQTETNDHLFQCPERGQWRAEFLVKLRKHLTSFRTAADIKTTIIANMTAWLNGEAGTAEYSFQDRIGWRCFIRGFVSVGFSEAQEALYRHQKLSQKEFSGSLWSQRLVEFLWHETLALWKTRCNEVHVAKGHRQSERELHEARIKVRNMYANKAKLLSTDRALLPGNVDQQLARRPHQIISFANTNFELVEFCLRDAHKAATEGCKDIREYFTNNQPAQRARLMRQVISAQARKRAAEQKTKKAGLRSRVQAGMQKITQFLPRRVNNQTNPPSTVSVEPARDATQQSRDGDTNKRAKKAKKSKKQRPNISETLASVWNRYFSKPERERLERPSAPAPEIPEDREPPDPSETQR